MNTTLELRYALDTFYLLISGALVMWMAAGFAMLEAGLVRAKNTTEILTKNIALYAIACIVYMLLGYNLMYPQAALNSYISDFSLLLSTDHDASLLLSKNENNWYQSDYFSLRADFFFQVVFVATSMSIVSGAIAERMKLWSFLIFSIFMTGFIYPVQGYWKWGGGFLDTMGFLDYAGAGIVHLCGAAAALAGVILLGPRKGRYGNNGEVFAVPGANLPLATLGTFILWLGWLGFNGGSQLVISNIEAANSVASVFVNTNTAAAGGAISALIVAQLIFGKADLTMALNGAIAGLVAITAEPLTPTPELALLIGSIGGGLVVLSIIALDKLRIDDPVGAISAHGIAGVWGLLAVCLSNTQALLKTQLLGVFVIFCWSFIASLFFWYLIKKTLGIRMSVEDEYNGADISECGIEAYPEFTNNH